MIKKVIVIAVIGCIIYAGILFATPFYRYHAFKSDVEELGNIVNTQPKDLSDLIMKRAKGYGIPITQGNVSINRPEGARTYRIHASWSETVNIVNLYKRTFHFSVDSDT